MQHERFQSVHDGRRLDAERVELDDTIVVESLSLSASAPSGQQREFEVVGIVEDADSAQRYAVCYNEGADEFIVTDAMGKLIPDDALAQEVLDDFLEHTAQAPEEDEA